MSSVRIDPSFIGFTSSDVPEGTNLYYSDSKVRLNRLDQMASPTSDVNMGGFKITNQATPSGPNDSVTKAYVDSIAQGLSPKNSVKVSTISALPAIIYNNGASGVGATLTAVSVGILTIDGVALSLNDRVLIKDQVSQLQNGIYTVTTLGTSLIAFILTRAIDNDTSDKIFGSFVFIETGTANSNSGFVNTNTSSITIGTTAITWTQFSGAGEIITGNGLTKTGNQIDVVTANSGRIVINSDSIDLASGIVTPGTYTKITVDTYGRATTGANATTSDIVEGSNLYYTSARVRAEVLTGLDTTTNVVITASDSILSGFGKLQKQITSSIAYEGLRITGAKYVRVSINNSVSGDNDAYTVPSGKRALVLSYTAYNTSGTNRAIYTEVKISGTYYRLTTSTNVNSNNILSNTALGYIAEAGEIIGANIAGVGINVYFKILEFDNTSPVKSIKSTSLANGNNILYTVPASTTALLLDEQLNSNTASSFNTLFYMNLSGGNRIITWYVVPSGQSVGSSYQISVATTVANNAKSSLDGEITLSTGDFIVINTNAATASQLAWINILEI